MERELRKLFKDSELLYDAMFCGKVAIGKLDKDIRVKIEFLDTHVHSHYDALRVKIINRVEGDIDITTFRFNDIIGLKNGYDPYFWDYPSCKGWYGFEPTARDYDKISATIHDYMSMFVQEDMEYEMRTSL